MKRGDLGRVYDDDLLLEHACSTACSLVRSFLSADEHCCRQTKAARATFYGANGAGFDGVSSFSALNRHRHCCHPISGPRSGEYGV